MYRLGRYLPNNFHHLHVLLRGLFVAALFAPSLALGQSSDVCSRRYALSDTHRESLSRELEVHPGSIRLSRVIPAKPGNSGEASVDDLAATMLSNMMFPGSRCVMVVHHPRGTAYCQMFIQSNGTYSVDSCR